MDLYHSNYMSSYSLKPQIRSRGNLLCDCSKIIIPAIADQSVLRMYSRSQIILDVSIPFIAVKNSTECVDFFKPGKCRLN